MNIKLNEITFFMKAAKKPFVSFSFVGMLMYVFLLISETSHGNIRFSLESIEEILLISAISWCVPFGFFIWFLGFKVTIEDGVLIYKTLFKIKELPLKEIRKYKTAHGTGEWGDMSKPYFRLEIFGKSRKPEIMLNLNVFGGKSCHELFRILKNVVEFNKTNGPK